MGFVLTVLVSLVVGILWLMEGVVRRLDGTPRDDAGPNGCLID